MSLLTAKGAIVDASCTESQQTWRQIRVDQEFAYISSNAPFRGFNPFMIPGYGLRSKPFRHTANNSTPLFSTPNPIQKSDKKKVAAQQFNQSKESAIIQYVQKKRARSIQPNHPSPARLIYYV
jgi:hypothetical protein